VDILSLPTLEIAFECNIFPSEHRHILGEVGAEFAGNLTSLNLSSPCTYFLEKLSAPILPVSSLGEDVRDNRGANAAAKNRAN